MNASGSSDERGRGRPRGALVGRHRLAAHDHVLQLTPTAMLAVHFFPQRVRVNVSRVRPTRDFVDPPRGARLHALRQTTVPEPRFVSRTFDATHVLL